jgi:hypothetical protein
MIPQKSEHHFKINLDLIGPQVPGEGAPESRFDLAHEARKRVIPIVVHALIGCNRPGTGSRHAAALSG